MSIDERMKQLQQLTEYLSTANSDIRAVVSRLGWSLEYKSNDDSKDDTRPRPIVHCPRNAEHRVPADSLQTHIESCAWRSEGYHDDDVPLPDTCDSTAGKNSIVIDSQLANAIIQDAAKTDHQMKTRGLRSIDHPAAKTADRIVSDYTTDERRAIYDYVISQLETEPVKLEELNFPFQTEKKGDHPKSLLEILAAERDAKRRRISHRAKKVSTNRKSHVEVMREVIQNQMELYQEWLAKDEKHDGEEITIEEKAVDPDHSRYHRKDYERKWDSHGASSSKSYVSRGSLYPESHHDSRQSSRSYKYSHNEQPTTTSRNRSRDRDRSKHRSSSYSSQQDRHRNGSRDNRRCESKDTHRRKGDNRTEKRDRKEKTNREENGRKAHDHKDRVKKEEDVKSMKKKEMQNVENYKGATSYNKQVDDAFEHCPVIKTEKVDHLNTRPICDFSVGEIVVGNKVHRKDTVLNIDTGSGSRKDVAPNVRDLPNEWSEDSEKSDSPKLKKRAKKKGKKSKHKQKKHSKKSKHSTLSDDGSTDFSC